MSRGSETFEVSSAIGKGENDRLIPVVRIHLEGRSIMIDASEALDLAMNLHEGAIRAQSDVRVASVMLARGATREECQAFLHEMQELG